MLYRIKPALIVLGFPALLAMACGKDKDPAASTDGSTEGSGGAGGDGGAGGEGGGGAPSATGGTGGVGNDGGGPQDAAAIPAMLTVDQSPAAFASLMCEKVYTCCPPADRMRLPVSDQANCNFTFSDLLKLPAMQVTAAVQAQRVTYDGAALANCLREYQGASCDAARPKGTVISHRECAFLTPLVEIGGTCEQSFECKGGYCEASKCVAKKANGATCAADDECPVRCSPQQPKTCVEGPPTDLCMGL